MCGIAGTLYFETREGPMESVLRMTDAMHARGPDDEGFAFFNGDAASPMIFGGPDTPEEVYRASHKYCPNSALPVADEAPRARLGLGHRRLSILDLSPGGHQPICTRDGRYWMVYNGEIYNFQEVRAELEERGVEFHTRSDSEVLLAAFAELGPGCLDHFNGMFAFAIWDTRDRRLFCARDRIGIKPFHYILRDDSFVFASDIPALIASGIYDAQVDPDGFYHGMSMLIAPRPMTAFKDVRALEPGTWVTISHEGRVARERYWSIPRSPVDDSRSRASYVEELDEILNRSVKRRLVADVPVGTFMSGGIDSTLISSIAAKHQPGIQALTLAIEDGQGVDEVPQARATAARWPMTHIVKPTHEDYSFAYRPEMTRAHIEPINSVSPNFIVCQLAAESGLVVVLNGSGSDEVFAGYERFHTLGHWRLARALGPLARLLPSRGRPGRLRDLAGRRGIADHYMYAFALFQTAQKQRLAHPALLRRVSEPETARLLEELYLGDSEPFVDDIQAMCHLEICHYIGNHTVPRLDQIMMHFSLEGRLPFLDHELVEFGMRLPSRFKIQGRARKQAVRDVASRYVDPSCLGLEKRGFSLPMERWMAGPLAGFVKEKLALLRDAELFDPDVLTAIIEDRYQPPIPPRRLWYLVATQLWRETFFQSS